VTVNGKIAKLGDKAELGKDAIKVSGKLIRGAEAPVYLAFYKPKQVISALTDPEGRQELADYLTKIHSRVYPVGRMDFMSEGLLLLTNDGELAEKIQKSPDIPRVYHIKVKGHPEADVISRLARGIRLEGKLIRPHSVRVAEKLTAKAKIEVVMQGHGAADLKRFFEMKGVLVDRIVRVAIGHLTLKGLEPGHYRPLQKSQMLALVNQPELGMRALAQAEEAREASFARGAFKEEAKPRIPKPRGARLKIIRRGE
jgi:23S rRNA pseudouridine2605 synthase